MEQGCGIASGLTDRDYCEPIEVEVVWYVNVHGRTDTGHDVKVRAGAYISAHPPVTESSGLPIRLNTNTTTLAVRPTLKPR